MVRSIYILVLIFLFSGVKAQNDTGVITFERRTFWIKISSKLPWMTQEEIDRDNLTWGNRQGRWSEEYDLSFTPEASTYVEKEAENSRGYSRRDGKFFLSRNYLDKQVKDYVTLTDKNYLVTGDIPKFKWKILNEIKEINGFLCMKAMTTDPVKDVPVIAWFTDQIPVPGGPEGYGGLPGMILSLDIGEQAALIEAIDVNLDVIPELSFPKKTKGKKISVEEYHEKTKKAIAKSMNNKRNPYRFIRY